jgi:hypothetical protein
VTNLLLKHANSSYIRKYTVRYVSKYNTFKTYVIQISFLNQMSVLLKAMCSNPTT